MGREWGWRGARNHLLGLKDCPLMWCVGSDYGVVCVSVCGACRLTIWVSYWMYGRNSFIEVISGLPPDQKEWLTPTQDLYLKLESSDIHHFKEFLISHIFFTWLLPKKEIR